MQSISNIDIKYCRYQYLILTDYHEEYQHPHCAEGSFGKTFGSSDSSSSVGGSGGRAGLEIIWNFPTCLHSPKRSMAWWITFRFIQHLTERLEKRQPNHFLSISILSHALSFQVLGCQGEQFFPRSWERQKTTTANHRLLNMGRFGCPVLF